MSKRKSPRCSICGLRGADDGVRYSPVYHRWYCWPCLKRIIVTAYRLNGK